MAAAPARLQQGIRSFFGPKKGIDAGSSSSYDPSQHSESDLNSDQAMAMCKASSSVHFISHSITSVREGPSKATWTPNADMYATDAGLVIKVELAGMRSDSLEITIEGSVVRISGVRPDGCRAAKCSFLMMEINYGPFERVLEVPPGYDLTQAKAAYLNGFLRLDVPMAQRPAKGSRVPVSEGESSV